MTVNKYISNLLVVVVFFLSGAVALVYEILWSRYLSELIGSSSLAEVVVLMIFLGGLSLGALLTGWLVDRWRNGLVMYGCLELVIGLYAVFFPFIYRQANELFLGIGHTIEFGSLEMFLCKVAIASLLILLPSIAMGGTLPTVSRYLIHSQQGMRRNVSMLYGLNTLGGVLGVLGGGFFLINQYGLASSMKFAGIMNLGLGITALIIVSLPKREVLVEADGNNSDCHSQEQFQDSRIFSPFAAKRAIFAAGVGGFAAMALQVAWIRYFSVVLGGTHSAFTIVVAAFIFGLGLGALIVRSRKFGSISLPMALALVFTLTTATVGIGLFFYGRVPFEMARFGAIIHHTPYAWPFHEILKFGFCFVLMLLPTLFSGMMLPVCIRIAAKGSDEVGGDIGKMYAVNTLGALLGIVVTSQLFFRIFSLPQTLHVIFLIYVGATLFLAYILNETGRKRMLAFTFLVLLLNVAFWSPWLPQQLFLNRLIFGQDPPLSYSEFSEHNKLNVKVGDFHGPEAQVIVFDSLIDKNNVRRTMFINGKADASVKEGRPDPDMENQVMTAHVPMLLHEKPEKVFVLGLGSGATTGEVLNFPEVKQVVTAELVAGVFDASKSFAEYNNRFWENPRHRMVIEDGKTFMRLAEDNFDVIIVQPTNIWQNGMARLYSEDFFRLVKSRLKPGGLVAQWFHLYEIDDVTVNIILKTFSQVFPTASVFKVGGSHDLLLVGYDQQWQFNPRQFLNRFYYSTVRATELQYGNMNPLALLIRETMGREDFQRYTGVLKSPINTDDLPVLEKAAEYGHFIDSPITFLAEHDNRLDPEGMDLLIHDYFSANGIDLSSLQGLIESSVLASDERLRQSIVFMLMDIVRNNYQEQQPPVAILRHLLPQLREIVIHPNYRKSPDQMTAEEAFNMLGAELIVWNKAASQLWAPDQKRLQKLYDRFAVGVDQENAVRVARDAGLLLARANICGAADPFFRIVEEKGGLSPGGLSPDDIGIVFSCEVKVGDPEKARYWWGIIEQNQLEVTAAMQYGKNLLDIKLGNSVDDAGMFQAARGAVIQQM